VDGEIKMLVLLARMIGGLRGGDHAGCWWTY
jgi:hypothetical protein